MGLASIDMLHQVTIQSVSIITRRILTDPHTPMSEFSEWHRRTDRGLSEFLDRGAMGDYKRQRPQVAQSYGREERNRSISGQDQSVSTRGSQDGHSPVVESDGRGRFTHSHQSFAHPDDRRSLVAKDTIDLLKTIRIQMLGQTTTLKLRRLVLGSRPGHRVLVTMSLRENLSISLKLSTGVVRKVCSGKRQSIHEACKTTYKGSDCEFWQAIPRLSEKLR